MSLAKEDEMEKNQQRATCAWCKGEVRQTKAGHWIHLETGLRMPCSAEENSASKDHDGERKGE